MRNGSYALLADRGVVAIGGPEAEPFLQNLITTDMAQVVTKGAGFGALLSPQGKIQFDFIITRSGEEFLFDLPLALAADFTRRMTLYRLRAKVTLENRSDRDSVMAFWGHDEPPAVVSAVPDPRLPTLGYRAIVPKDAELETPGYALASEADYHLARIALGVPEAGRDFAFGDAFPHDADMDDLGGLDFRKGCYVGQEIVSRMHHRGTARRRAVALVGDGPLPEAGTAIIADGKIIGTLGSTAGAAAIGMIRLDRAKRALDQGIPITADGINLTVSLPSFAHFGWPENGEEEGAA